MVNGNLRKGHAVVLGAGTMGSGIAALLASIGWRVHLLDQGEIAHRALERLQQSGAFYQPSDATRITPGECETPTWTACATPTGSWKPSSSRLNP
jgi:glycine/D-amino acid oxidase-like deaminating enzyme